MPQETDPDLPVRVQESPAEAWVIGGLLQGGGTDCSIACMGPFEGHRQYLHYLHHSLASGQITGREGSSVQFSSATQLCLTLCDPMNCSTAGLPVHHQLPEFTQTHVHRASDAIQPYPVVPFSSCPQSLPASESFPMSQLFSNEVSGELTPERMKRGNQSKISGQSTGVSASASFFPKNTQD